MLTLTAADFTSARYPVTLADDEIQLWFFPARYGGGAHVEEAWLRQRLASHVEGGTDDLVLRRGAHGKPYLEAPLALEFNLSHSRGATLLGLSRRQALGVDVETYHRSRPVLDLARRYFAETEAAALASLDADSRQAAFLQLWSCKEAVFKALGRGIGFGLARVAFALDEAGAPSHMNVIDTSAGSLAQWQIIGLAPATGHTGAAAWQGPMRALRAFAALPP